MADVTGEIEKSEDGVLLVRRIHVRYRLRVDRVDDAIRQKIDRCMDFHQKKCPVARSLEGAIDITTELELVESG